MIIHNGWLNSAKKVISPNFNERPSSAKINLLVIHNISLPPSQFGNSYIELFFQNKLPYQDHPYFETIRGVEVSSHFLIKRCGKVVQFVSCDDRAWHAGASSFCGEDNCNDFSIGIELEGTDDIPYTENQYDSLNALTNAIKTSYPEIDNDRITGHSTIAPGRKTDPGSSFDWQAFFSKLA